MQPKSTMRACAQCGSAFIVTSKKPRQKFCSQPCAWQAQNRPVEERFWSKVNRTDTCWLWTGANNGHYGIFGGGKGTVGAHRMAYAMTYGPIPDGMNVCHRCDVRLCVRPDHLFLGSQDDNLHDMYKKGRGPTGERHHSRTKPYTVPHGETHGQAILTETSVREIRRRHAANPVVIAALAREFGVSTTTIDRVIRYKTWRHIP